jgi:hypothetical protein
MRAVAEAVQLFQAALDKGAHAGSTACAALQVELDWGRLQADRKEALLRQLKAEGDRTVLRKPEILQKKLVEARLGQAAVEAGVVPLLLPLLRSQASCAMAARCLLHLVEGCHRWWWQKGSSVSREVLRAEHGGGTTVQLLVDALALQPLADRTVARVLQRLVERELLAIGAFATVVLWQPGWCAKGKFTGLTQNSQVDPAV